MKHPILTVHRRTYGLLYQIIHFRSIKAGWLKRIFISVVFKAMFVFVVIFYIFHMATPPTPKKLDFFVNRNPLFCDPVKHSKSLRFLLLNNLKVQIELETSKLLKATIKPNITGELLPIANMMIDRNVTICPFKPPKLVGAVNVNKNIKELNVNLQNIESRLKKRKEASSKLYDSQHMKSRNLATTAAETDNFSLHHKQISLSTPINQSAIELPLYLDKVPDGINSPAICYPHRRTAIVVPYRNREKHLKLFIRHLHKIMIRQQLEYGIYVINLAGNGQFNRAKLLNIGYVEAMRHYERYDCIIFHDVDLFAEDDRNLYTCTSQPKHMSAAIDIFEYKVPYKEIFGGVSSLTPYQFEAVNGYSNEYWGWGGEDDDMYLRLCEKCMRVSRPPINIARYQMLKHAHDKGNEIATERFNLLHATRQRMKHDGLSSLKYKVINRDYQLLYNNITVLIGHPIQSFSSKKQMVRDVLRNYRLLSLFHR